jgi:4-hydroxyphenylacetate 3-monooxygenase
MTTEDRTTVTRPMNGEEYLESLKDGREIWIYGERVKDVTTHPVFRNPVRMVARLYNSLHDPEKKEVLTIETDTGSGGFTHKFFKTPTNVEELVGSRDAIAEWARMPYGWMERSPDYKASFLGTLGANADFYDPYQENAKRWYRESQENVYYWNHALVQPPTDRNRDVDDVKDVFMHVEEETDNGVIVSGPRWWLRDRR